MPTSIINVLDFATANLIAAGEVVERPASVVKELLENSIDAGADKITVEIRSGGISFIRVTDNGCGMSAEDLPRCILRHATSKIASGDDLAAIGTLGFRGEALAATAAVSNMKLVSKRKCDKTAHQISVKYGVASTVSECGAPDGTAITVSELFSNVPARRKFLKQDKTEAAAVQSVCEKLALSSPGIALTYVCDGENKFSTSGDGSLKSAVYATLGRQFANEMIPVSGISGGISVSGGIAPPVLSRTNRTMELVFLNGRYIKSTVISTALETALQSYVPKERYPAAVLFITVHPSAVDVNVHPSKLEVKFSSDKPVFDAVYYAVKAASESGVRPVLAPETVSYRKPLSPFVPVTDKYSKQDIVQTTAFDKPLSDSIRGDSETASEPIQGFVRSPSYGDISSIHAKAPSNEQTSAENTRESTPGAANPMSETPKAVREAVREWRYIGEAFDTYVFIEQGDTVLIIDKHAAHERLIFEQLKIAMKSRIKNSQIIMIPLTLPLSPEEEAAAEQYGDEIRAAGFGFTVADGEASITEYPSNLTDYAAATLFSQMCSELVTETTSPSLSRELLFERALYQASCKAAIKGGDKSGEEELKNLVTELMLHTDVTYCPHGRPVAFIMTKSAIERRFGRT